MDGMMSKWRNQTSGLLQGSVLAPFMFIYTNYLLQLQDIWRFIYADDLCITIQSRSFKTIEERQTKALSSLSDNYKKKWHLKANPIKTGMFITSEESPSKQKIENKMGRQRTEKTFTSSLSWCHSWSNTNLQRACQQVQEKKVDTWNSLSKIATTKWGADAKTLKQTALALSYTTEEHCAPVWEDQVH